MSTATFPRGWSAPPRHGDGPALRVSQLALRYSGVVLLVGAVVALKVALGGDRSWGAAPYQFFVVATIVASWYAGRGGAVLAIMLSLLGGAYVSPTVGTWTIAVGELGGLILFAIELSLAAALTLGFQRSRRRVELTARQLERAHGQLRKENRAHRALSAANEIAFRARSEDALLRAVCDAIVTVAKYRMAWVGWAMDDGSRTVKPVAKAGLECGYLDHAHVTWADDEHGRGPVGTAIREGRTTIQRDIAHALDFAPWREEAKRRGYESMIALPIRIDSRVAAALAIYATEPDAFDDDEVKLLEQLVANAAFAIATLRARTAAERARGEREELVRFVSHELRTPLTSVITWAQALEADRGRDAGRLSRGLEAILRCAREESHLVDELILASSILRGELHLRFEPLPLGPILRSCVEELRHKAEQRSVALTVHVAHEPTTRGDRPYVREILCNVLSNGIKFTPSGGTVHAELTREEGDAVVRVRDTGKGIAAEELPHVFELIRCSDGATARAERGIGAGLFIARALVEAHGGTMRAESEGPGRGATIVIRLPASGP